MTNPARTTKTLTLLAGAWLVLAAASSAAPIALKPGSALWLEGDSSLHAFSSTATVVEVSGDWQGDWKLGAFQLTVPVEGLKSGKGGLDNNMRKALNAKEHPAIRFALRSADVGQDLTIKALGTLTIAGKDREVELAAQGTRTEEGFRVQGRYELLMTDYGVKPPVMMMGAVKTRNKVVVRYDIVLYPQ